MFARNTYSCPFCLFDIYGVTDYDFPAVRIVWQ